MKYRHQQHFLKDLIYLFIFRERGREGKREKDQCAVASRVPPTGDLVRNPGMCPDWVSNQQTFGSQAGAQSTEPHQSGLFCFLNAPSVNPREFSFTLSLLIVISWLLVLFLKILNGQQIFYKIYFLIIAVTTWFIFFSLNAINLIIWFSNVQISSDPSQFYLGLICIV